MNHRNKIRLFALALLLAAVPVAYCEEPSSDPIFLVNQQLQSRDDNAHRVTMAQKDPNDANAEQVILTPRPLLPQSSSADWTLSDEEIAPPSSTLRIPTSAISAQTDPEWTRHVPETDDNIEPASSNTATVNRRSVAASIDDPENFSRAGTEEAGTASDIVPPLHIPSTRELQPILALNNALDTPRYGSEQGSESDAADPVPDPALPATPAQPLPHKSETKIKTEKKPRTDKPGKTVKTVKKPAETKQITDAQAIPESDAEVAEVANNKNKETAPIQARDARAARLLAALQQETPLGSVLVRVIDVATSTLIPARVRICDLTDSAAEAALPLGTWCDGVTQAQVISGPVRVEISRGRFKPLYLKGFVAEAEVTSQLDAVVSGAQSMNFTEQGWYLADFDLAQKAATGEQPVWMGDSPTLETLALAARAENVQIVGVSIPENADVNEWQAKLSGLSHDGLLLIPVFSGPRQSLHGTGLGLGVRSWDGIAREMASPEKSLQECFEEIRVRGGLAVYKNLLGSRKADLCKDIFPLFPRLQKNNYFSMESGSISLYAATELPFDTVTGAYDVLAFDGSDAAENLWFNLLREGYPISVIGTSGGSLEAGTPPVGQTFVQIEGGLGALTQEAVVDAVKKGRTGVSFGPAVFAKILEREMGPGSILPADGRALTLQIKAYATMRQSAQLEKVEILRNGVVIESRSVLEGQSEIPDLRIPIRETSTAWYVVRVTEKTGATALNFKYAKAWTSPIFFRGVSFAPPALARTHLKGVLRNGMTPTAGTITVIAAGAKPYKTKTDVNGRYKITVPSNATLVFAAEGCDPFSVKIFEHPRVQKALGAMHNEKSGPLAQQLSKISIFPSWNLLLSELDWDISLLAKATIQKK